MVFKKLLCFGDDLFVMSNSYVKCRVEVLGLYF